MFNRPKLRCEGMTGSLPCWRTNTEGVRMHEDGRMLCMEHIQEAEQGRQIKVGDLMWERVLVCNPIDDLPAGERWRKCTVYHVTESTVSIMYETYGLAECKVIRRGGEIKLKFNLQPGDIPFKMETRLVSS